MKRKTAIVFIVLANFIILAHAVVPHHHYHDDIYSHHDKGCCNSSILFSFGHNADDCSHDDSEREACKLQELLSKLVLNTKERENFVAALESDFQDYYIANLLLPNMDVMPQIYKVTYTPYGVALPQNGAVSSPSLRAPPSYQIG